MHSYSELITISLFVKLVLLLSPATSEFFLTETAWNAATENGETDGRIF